MTASTPDPVARAREALEVMTDRWENTPDWAADPSDQLLGDAATAVLRDLIAHADAQAAELERLREAAQLTKDWDAWATRAMETGRAIEAERDAARAEVERERVLADRLAEALRTAFLHVMEPDRHGAPIHAALAAWRAAREAPDA